MAVVLPASLNCYMSALRPQRLAPLLILAYSRTNDTNARRMAFVLLLALDLTFGTHFHVISDNAQLCRL